MMEISGEGSEILVPLFVLPADVYGLFICCMSFLGIAILIYIFEKWWINRTPYLYGESKCAQRILIWEFGTVVSLIFTHTFGFYCVVLPLLFLLAFLSMWYLVRVVARQ